MKIAIIIIFFFTGLASSASAFSKVGLSVSVPSGVGVVAQIDRYAIRVVMNGSRSEIDVGWLSGKEEDIIGVTQIPVFVTLMVLLGPLDRVIMPYLTAGAEFGFLGSSFALDAVSIEARVGTGFVSAVSERFAIFGEGYLSVSRPLPSIADTGLLSIFDIRGQITITPIIGIIWYL